MKQYLVLHRGWCDDVPLQLFASAEAAEDYAAKLRWSQVEQVCEALEMEGITTSLTTGDRRADI
jgi:hypothetical protein